jgi:hypothetical protein
MPRQPQLTSFTAFTPAMCWLLQKHIFYVGFEVFTVVTFFSLFANHRYLSTDFRRGHLKS